MVIIRLIYYWDLAMLYMLARDEHIELFRAINNVEMPDSYISLCICMWNYLDSMIQSCFTLLENRTPVDFIRFALDVQSWGVNVEACIEWYVDISRESLRQVSQRVFISVSAIPMCWKKCNILTGRVGWFIYACDCRTHDLMISII